MLNFRIEAISACPANAGVFGHRSSDRGSKEILVTGIIPYIHVSYTVLDYFFCASFIGLLPVDVPRAAPEPLNNSNRVG
ncbi:hypothetical protein SAMN04489724_4008 [Algoriphagus locisalis]|uniref:Uncharacterized protein n=1 Tax=Algoriphagus locisalis TaxID=305507 RepID=A0A1I7DFJ0_9BACT|nr:hypothetical protein SAMN04489724_4008 [Algoriphagus locisalis]